MSDKWIGIFVLILTVAYFFLGLFVGYKIWGGHNATYRRTQARQSVGTRADNGNSHARPQARIVDTGRQTVSGNFLPRSRPEGRARLTAYPARSRVGGAMPISRYPKGARKAYRRMQKQYGAKKGRAVFYAVANKKGKGKSTSAKVRSAYRKKRKK